MNIGVPKEIKNNENREILIITADAVKETGTISFKFMIDADLEGELEPMPQKYGYVWRTKNDDSCAFNVFEGRKGLVAGGRWTKQDDFEWEKKMFDALPSCTLLMDIDLLLPFEAFLFGFLHLDCRYSSWS